MKCTLKSDFFRQSAEFIFYIFYQLHNKTVENMYQYYKGSLQNKKIVSVI